MAIVYLTRHGESYNNKNKILGGDPELTDVGREQARKNAEIIKDVNLEAIVVSEKIRSKQTGEIYKEFHPEAEWKEDPRFNEIYAGVADGMAGWKIIITNFRDLLKYYTKDPFNAKFKGGESYKEATKRVKPAMHHYRYEHKGNILIVGHLGMIRCNLVDILKIPGEKLHKMDVPHDIIFRIEPEGEVAQLKDKYLIYGFNLVEECTHPTLLGFFLNFYKKFTFSRKF